jgi:hypothetical protein
VSPGPKRLSYDLKNVAFAPYGVYWREMRKVFIVELLSMRRVKAACIRNITLTLIKREDDTRSWGNFLVYFSLYHNVIPSKGLGIHTYSLLASQEYARC